MLRILMHPQGANIGEFLAASIGQETGKLQIMQTLVGTSEHLQVLGSSQVSPQLSQHSGVGGAQPGLYSVYGRANNSSGTLSAARPNAGAAANGADHGEDRKKRLPVPRNTSSVGAAVHRFEGGMDDENGQEEQQTSQPLVQSSSSMLASETSRELPDSVSE